MTDTSKYSALTAAALALPRTPAQDKTTPMKKTSKFAALSATALALPRAAMAATTGGGGMPYSAGLNTFSTSVRGEIAGILILVGIVGGVGLWIAGGQLEGMLNTIARVIIGGCIVGGVVVFMTTIGITGAVM